MKKVRFWYWVQTIVLLGGTIFAWITVVRDFQRFYGYEGTIFKISNCVVPNPVTTPCFYGAFAFLIALIWSIKLLRQNDPSRRLTSQRRLRWLIVASVLFAWGNFAYVAYKFYAPQADHKGCSGIAVSTPFITPCFFGSVIFLIALVVALIVIRKSRASGTSTPQPSVVS